MTGSVPCGAARPPLDPGGCSYAVLRGRAQRTFEVDISVVFEIDSRRNPWRPPADAERNMLRPGERGELFPDTTEFLAHRGCEASLD